MKTSQLLGSLLAAILIISGCSGKKDSEPTLKDANKLFSDGSYTYALDVYLDLIPEQGSPARVGAGWCYLRLNQLSEASVQFTAAAVDSIPDGYAGWSFVLWALDQPRNAITRADFVLAKQPGYISALDERINAEHLIWIQAASYLQLQNYSACALKIQLLDPSFVPNLNDTNIEDLLLVKLEILGAAF